jgi:hypothetical protein
VGTFRLLGVTAAIATLVALGQVAFAQDKKSTATPPPPKTAAKPASPCKGLDETACNGKSAECQWISPKTGKQKPYCKLKQVPKKKVKEKEPKK